MTTTMSVSEVVETYGAAWGETDDAKRRALLERSWADDGEFIDPQSHTKTREELVELIASFQKQFAGAAIVATSGVEEHHGWLRFTWTFQGADGNAIFEGFDVGELAPDGRLQKIVGFWGPAPALG